MPPLPHHDWPQTMLSPHTLRTLHTILLNLAICLCALIEGSCSPPLLFVEPCTLIMNASTTMPWHHSLPFATLHYDPWHLLFSLPLIPLPSTHPSPFYSSLSLPLWSLILPEPQACLTTPHQFLDLAYTLFLLRVLITQPVHLAYPPFFPSFLMPPPILPSSIWTLPAHRYILATHFPLLHYTSQKYILLLHVTPFLIIDIPPVTLCLLSFLSLHLCSIATYISCL